MKNLQKDVRSGIIIGVSFLSTTLLGGMIYAAYSTLSVNINDSLSASKWNELVSYTVPPGAVVAFYGTNCPANWSPADGTANGVKKTDGTPGTLDLRGEFIRGIDTAGVGPRNVDSGRGIGTSQWDLFASHTHGVWVAANGVSGSYWVYAGAWSAATSNPTGGSETRPRNVALLYCVKN